MDPFGYLLVSNDIPVRRPGNFSPHSLLKARSDEVDVEIEFRSLSYEIFVELSDCVRVFLSVVDDAFRSEIILDPAEEALFAVFRERDLTQSFVGRGDINHSDRGFE